jgi:alkaline phosphatase
LHLTDTRAIAPVIYGPSWSFHDFGKIPYSRRQLIDYVFVRNGVEALRYGVLAETENEGFLSDHAPVLVTVACPADETSESRRDKEQTYVMPSPYDVEKIAAPKGKKIKNVILMIGDGMSLMHIYSAWTANRGKLYLDNCQTVGLSKTYCADKLITDSGAGGTAMACGQKTNYHSVGVDTQGRPLKSLVDLAAAKGKSSGMAVTCRLWDATPADFCCHNVDREAEADITADYVNSPVDYVFGGGAKLFENRADGRNLFAELQAKGYQTPRSWNELSAIRSGKVFAVPYDVDTPLPAERGDLLARASLKGIELLNQNKNGFFMMIEGSQLDDYGHFNDLDMLMQETYDFDRTIGAIYKWAAQDGETLVVVTADHETGGLTLVDGNLQAGKIVCKFSTGGHSGVMVPVYAFGPGAEAFTGIYENTAIFDKIKKLLGL